MPEIVTLTGMVKFPLTLDPSSWIFDDRKIDINDYFSDEFNLDEFLEAQKDERAGAAIPRMAKGQRKYKRSEWLTGSFCMPAKIFVENSEPEEQAKTVTFQLKNGSTSSVPIEEVKLGVFAFSENGKIIQQDGPIHFYYSSQDKRDTPIKGIKGILIEA